MKVIAYYLPQYHRVPENDKWWGEGFTEWTNVKKHEKLFGNHDAPFLPQDNNFYDIDSRETVQWQTELANEHGVYGFAYYHYWFNGSLLLERPAENLLRWKDIPQNFFFYWANHSWVRSWSGSVEILKKQTYGGQDDWEAHLQYFLPFFRDERYIKLDGRPVISIFDANTVDHFDDMIGYWRRRIKEEGFADIYVIENAFRYTMPDDFFSECSDAIVIREPNASEVGFFRLYRRLKRYPRIHRLFTPFFLARARYEDVVRRAISNLHAYRSPRKTYFTSFTGWDNTSRHGRMGYVIHDERPSTFAEHLQQINKKVAPDDFVFINAWNEWAEGMALEPSARHGRSFLQVIKNIMYPA